MIALPMTRETRSRDSAHYARSEKSLSFNMREWNRPPDATVLGLLAVVAEHVYRAFRHDVIGSRIDSFRLKARFNDFSRRFIHAFDIALLSRGIGNDHDVAVMNSTRKKRKADQHQALARLQSG